MLPAIMILTVIAVMYGCGSSDDEEISEEEQNHIDDQWDNAINGGIKDLNNPNISAEEILEEDCKRYSKDYFVNNNLSEYDSCMRYGGILSPEYNLVFDHLLEVNRYNNATLDVSSGRYLLSDVKPFNTSVENRLFGTFFSAVLKPNPNCYDDYIKEYCEVYLSKFADTFTYDDCAGVANNGLADLKEQFAQSLPENEWSYQILCNERENYSTCGDNPPEVLKSQSESFENICSQFPVFDVLGFATFGDYGVRNIKFLHMSQQSKDKLCDFHTEFENAVKNNLKQMPCGTTEYSAFLFYNDVLDGKLQVKTEYNWIEKFRNSNECVYVMNSDHINNTASPRELFSAENIRRGITLMNIITMSIWDNNNPNGKRDFRAGTIGNTEAILCSDKDESSKDCDGKFLNYGYPEYCENGGNEIKGRREIRFYIANQDD